MKFKSVKVIRQCIAYYDERLKNIMSQSEMAFERKKGDTNNVMCI